MRLVQATLWFLVPTALALVSGWKAPESQVVSHPQASRPPAYRVKGRLIVGNIPAANARIAFFPMDPEKSQGRYALAVTGANGVFELTTYSMYDGAPEGDYKVVVTWPDDSMPVDECECVDILQHDRLGGKYADRDRTPLIVTLRPKVNEVNLCTMAAPSTKTGLPGFGIPPGGDGWEN